jgi:DNA-binding NtrC family response regulator
MKSINEVRLALWSDADENLMAVENTLLNMGCRVERVGTFERLSQLMEGSLDVVVVECEEAPNVLHWMNGVRLAGSDAPPVLTLASAFDVRKYLGAMNLGAFDCVAMPIHEKELLRVINRALEVPRHDPLLLSA